MCISVLFLFCWFLESNDHQTQQESEVTDVTGNVGRPVVGGSADGGSVSVDGDSGSVDVVGGSVDGGGGSVDGGGGTGGGASVPTSSHQNRNKRTRGGKRKIKIIANMRRCLLVFSVFCILFLFFFQKTIFFISKIKKEQKKKGKKRANVQFFICFHFVF